jgi:hypothetical protein
MEDSMKHQLGQEICIEKPLECLRCNTVLHMAAAIDDDGSPEPGAVMLCFHCGCVMVLDNDNEPRAPSRHEMREIQNEGLVVKALASLCQSQKQLIDELKRERDAYAERAETVPGGSPPGDQGHGGTESLPLGVSGADRFGQDTGGGDDR